LVHLQNLQGDFEKYICLNWGEDKRNTCGEKDLMLTTKEISLYSGCDRGVIKYGFSNNSKSHGKTISL